MKPLTIDELKALQVGDWVWIVEKEISSVGKYHKIIDGSFYAPISIFLRTDSGRFDYAWDFSDYGAKWLAYKNKEQAECKGATYCPMCQNDIFDAYVPVSNEGDICEKLAEPGEEWVYHANYCPNCGRRLISEEAERRLAELQKGE